VVCGKIIREATENIENNSGNILKHTEKTRNQETTKTTQLGTAKKY
jgi:hypothetical protein